MARITVEEVYREERNDVMSVAMADYIINSRQAEYDLGKWVKLLFVKHILTVVNKTRTEGDS